MAYNESDFLQLSGLQHFAFCPRQWALIHIENLWQENYLTITGKLLHSRAHNEQLRERRGDILILRGLTVYSRELGISGKCDVVEFHNDPNGIPIFGEEGTWQPFPIEYKRGRPKNHQADELQLCAQAMCLEEMLCCCVPRGALFYGEIKRREEVLFSLELRQTVQDMLTDMQRYAQRGYTPKVKSSKRCQACSLKEQCLPKLQRTSSCEAYIKKYMEKEDEK